MMLWATKVRADLSDNKGLILVIMLAGSLTFVGWMSLDKITEISAKQASMHTIFDLEQENSRLQIQYHQVNLETHQADLEQAEHRLLQDFAHLAQWAQKLQEEGEQIALHMNYQIRKAEQTPSSIQGITIVPLKLHLRSLNDQNGYRSFLKFLQVLEQSGPRINIKEVAVNGDGKKATTFTVGLSTWMKTQDSVEL